ncbi:MAG: hypothetical protein KF734_05305 [Saprospiraceae bacterium]|nr:hypothetical protein [Saprospiraceae bacterium]
MRFFPLLALLMGFFPALAQEPGKHELAPCGTPPGLDPFLLEYLAYPEQFVEERSSDTLKLGVQIHLLARDNGTGRFSPGQLLDAFCRLNLDFADTRIRLYFKNEWNLINNTGWYQHQTIPQGIDMMLTNNVEGALNSYFAANVAGNCGYNLPYAGVAMSHGCSGPNDHTWAHEVGHNLSLPHPFIGWEGKVYSFANPTPDTLTYDYTYFHDTIDTQIPAPLDTALVEYVDGSNCAIAADLICDTKPDYLSYRWDCDNQGKSLVQQKDPTGATFFSDGTLFMSYSFDKCANRFSDEQITIMRAALLNKKPDWLTDEQPQGDIEGTPTLLAPIGGQLSPTVGTVLQWSSVPNATRYVVQMSRFSNFSIRELDVVTSDTTWALGNLVANQNYYWRVRPFNDWYVCTTLSPSATFKSAVVVSTSAPDAEGWRCYPTLLTAGQPLTMETPVGWLHHSVQCSVYDAMGRMVWQSNQLVGSDRTLLHLPSASWAAGTYRLVVLHEGGVKTVPLVVAR